MAINIFTDGASRGNPGKAGAGAVIYNGNNILDEISVYLGEKTNNEAEYIAVIKALERLEMHKITEANVFCDSQLLVKQIQGEYKVKAPTIIPLFKEVKDLLENKNIKFNWVRREENTKADELANKAIDEV